MSIFAFDPYHPPSFLFNSWCFLKFFLKWERYEEKRIFDEVKAFVPLSHFFPLFPFFSSVFSLLSSFPLRYLRSYFFRSFFSLQSSICTTHSCSLHPTFLTRIYEMANSSSVVFRFVDGDGETTTTTKTRKTTTFEEDLFLTYSTHVRFHCSRLFFRVRFLNFICLPSSLLLTAFQTILQFSNDVKLLW